MDSNLRQGEGDAGILPGGAGVELSHIEELEQVPPHLVHRRPDGLVQAQHLHTTMSHVMHSTF